MPFGLTNALTTFMRMMDDILWPFTNSFVAIYLDGILIFSRTWEKHLQYIQHVLNTLRWNKLYTNINKFSFVMEKIQYLEYIVDAHVVHVDSTNIHVIQNWPTPAILIELRSFLGIANFYCKFVLRFSHITWPLS